MLNVTLKGIWSHKRRLIGTILAVVLGVAFLAGTLVLGDTMRAGFSDLFTDVNASTDAEVRSATEIGTDQTQERGLLDESLTDTIRGVDGVAAAAPQVGGQHCSLVSGSNTIGAASTSSSVTVLRNTANGLRAACWRAFTEMRAKVSGRMPCCSM